METKKPLESAPMSSKEKVLQSGRDSSTFSDELLFYNEKLIRVETLMLKQTVHRSMVALTFFDANKKINFGSGVLISRDTILTTAQNIFNKELNAENTDFKMYIGANGVAEEYHQAEGWRYPEEFKTCNTSAKLSHNYAIVKLKKPVYFQQYLSLSLACKECLLRENKKIELKVYGFPCEYENNFIPFDKKCKRMVLYQYELVRKGRINGIDIEQSKIGYQISALPGQSGCPIIVDDKIIAVHVGGDDSQFNVGKIVDISFMHSLWKWSQELNAAPFQFSSSKVCYHIEKTLEKMRLQLDLNWNNLKNVDLHEYSNIVVLDLQGNQLRQIDLAYCPRLTKLGLGRNQLQWIDLTNNRHLTKLYLDNNQLQEVDVRANVNLTHLQLYKNQLQEVDLMANVNLTQLLLQYNRITEIDLTKNIKLKKLCLQRNRLAHVRLFIDQDVEEIEYTGSFDFSNQQSAVCRVDVQCEGQTEAVRRKAIMLVDFWMKKYSKPGNQWYNDNIHNCAYSFLAFWSSNPL